MRIPRNLDSIPSTTYTVCIAVFVMLYAVVVSPLVAYLWNGGK